MQVKQTDNGSQTQGTETIPPVKIDDAQYRMLVEERRRHILDLLDLRKRVTVRELADVFSVSAVTVRGDLEALSQMGALVRSHGGAVKPHSPAPDLPISLKERLRHSEKARIGVLAASLIRDGETVLFDSGTTTAAVARCVASLRLNSLTVITNALNIALELANLPQVSIIMLGGIVRGAALSLVGPHAQQALSNLTADRLFLGVDGIDPEMGLTTPDVLEAQLSALMIKVSREVIVVADSSKFMNRTLSVIGKLDAMHKLVTDDGIPPHMLEPLRTAGVEVLIAK
ncbi:MAG TPA: DeoR/GlpR family DNA-binding transcription regulator [Acidobacteriota bacterium]|nr:DeoR/GlpR family DNA-binding transcription regulator [Acidobacteriota bacterium]